MNGQLARVAGALSLLFMLVSAFALRGAESRSLLLVVGAPGEEEWGKVFEEAVELWKTTAEKAGFQSTIIGHPPATNSEDRTRLLTTLTNEMGRGEGELWLVFIGHGTFDGKTAKFNLHGPDVSAEEMAAAMKSSQRRVAVINCASASGPFVNALAGTNRVVITATRSGYELNVTRFGTFFAKAIADASADLDKDGQTSLLEAYLMASREVDRFYKEEGRLATEHALLDDNGDGLGTPAEWFVGVRAVKKPERGKSVDGLRAHQMTLVRGTDERQLTPEQRARRDELEQQLNALRERKSSMGEGEYYGELEQLMLEVARLYQGT